MDADGSNLVPLIAPAQIAATGFGPSVSWSSLGRKIAFIAVGAKDPDIWVVNANGTNPHRLLRTPHRYEFQVDWSPYEDRIAVTDCGGYFCHIYVMNANGKHLRAINPGWHIQAAMPRWSPSGQQIAYMAWEGSASVKGAEIWVAQANGRYPQRLTHNAVIDGDPSWSSSGGKIVFVRGRSENDWIFAEEKRSPAEIYVMNTDGTGVTRLTDNSTAEGSPAWQPIAPS